MRTPRRRASDVSRARRPVAVLAVALMLPLGLPASAGPAVSQPPDRFIVGLRSIPEGLEPGSPLFGGRVTDRNEAVSFAVVETRDPQRLLARALADPSVRYVEEDRAVWRIQPIADDVSGLGNHHTIPDDPRWEEQYGPQQIRAPLAWTTTFGTTDAAVCVIDTGVRHTHEDLAGTRWLGWADFVNGDPAPYDDHGHGTHVAGSAAATVGNGIGIAGVGNVGLYGAKALSSGGSGTSSSVANAITWCAEETIPRTVINMSLGSSSASSAIQDAVRFAFEEAGRLVVSSSGNTGRCQSLTLPGLPPQNCVGYPAAFDEVIAVGCTDAREQLCTFSSIGPTVELAAPGASVLSLWASSDSAYRRASGTSMSSPHVAGAAALAWSHNLDLTAGELRTRLQETAMPLGEQGRNREFGYGRVDAFCVVHAITPCASDGTTPADPPGAPVNLTAVPGPGTAGHVTLNWLPPESGPPPLAYRIERGLDPDGPFEWVGNAGGSARGYRDLRLEPLREYFYRVLAVNAAGAGPLSRVRCTRASPWVPAFDIALCPPGTSGSPPVTPPGG